MGEPMKPGIYRKRDGRLKVPVRGTCVVGVGRLGDSPTKCSLSLGGSFRDRGLFRIGRLGVTTCFPEGHSLKRPLPI